MTTAEKIARLRQKMKENKIDAYIIPTADHHQSEYVGSYFKVREFLTGFTGSAGTALITEKEAFLWTDGRYFLQAAIELEGSEIVLQKMGEPEVPSLKEFLKNNLPDGAVIGFDGRTVNVKEGQEFEAIAAQKGGAICFHCDLAGEIWEERPALSTRPAFALELCYAGETIASKLDRVRKRINNEDADFLLVTSLDDIGWLLNLRGRDVAYFPLLLSYAVIGKDHVELYVDRQKLNEKISADLEKNKVVLYPYEDIYKRIKTFEKNQRLLMDPEQVNYTLYRNIPSGVQIVKRQNPLILMKSIKNATEVKNIRLAHIKDGIAHTRFMYWLKQNIGKIEITEITASQKLEELRAQQEHFLGPSFDPICAYREHAAIVHYSATEETDMELEAKGLFLTDTGGHYYEGSTDITRTIALGELTEEERIHFTLAAAGMLNLADAKFLYGCTGANLDYLAREPFWRRNLNFNHGTGHGVGYLGNIHEPPARIHWRQSANLHIPLEENMVVTDEPGIYIEGSHGVRTENELLVCKGEKNTYGQFMYFETLTFVPIDLDSIVPQLLTEQERRLLNAYHREVYQKIAPYLTPEEQRWLRTYTREIKS